MNSLPWWVKPVIFLAAVGISFLVGFGHGLGQGREELRKFEEKVAEQGAAQERENAKKEIAAQKVNEETHSAYGKVIEWLRSPAFGGGVQPRASGGGVPKVAPTATRVDGPTADTQFVGKCAETTAQLEALQGWVTRITTLESVPRP